MNLRLRGCFSKARGRTIAGAGALACCALMAIPAVAGADTPPTLSVSATKLKDGTGYTVTGKLTGGDWQQLDCTNGDPSTAQYPDLGWSQDKTPTSPSDSNLGGPLDSFSVPLQAITDATEDGDVNGTSCDQTTFTTDPSVPFGVQGADGTNAYAPGTWYFQASIFCDSTNDSDCTNGSSHYTNVASVKIPTVTGSGGNGGSTGSGGNGGSTGSGGNGGSSGGNGGSSGGNGGSTGSGGNGGSTGTGGKGGSTGKSGCASGTAGATCRINLNYQHALAVCGKKKGKAATSCRKTALINDHRQLALLRCQSLKGSAKAACVKRANGLKS